MDRSSQRHRRAAVFTGASPGRATAGHQRHHHRLSRHWRLEVRIAKGFEMNTLDWSRYDLAAAVDYALARGKVWLVGHRPGGHAIGPVAKPNDLQASCLRCRRRLARLDAAPGALPCLGAVEPGLAPWSPASMAISRWQVWAGEDIPMARTATGRSGATCRITFRRP